ncbi:MAG: GAF domain-containing protein [Maribacter sp.]|nr:MAG: GAF domain-containing protein [Maribacter sp.]
MVRFSDNDFPLDRLISFNKLLKVYDRMAGSEDEYLAAKARYVLEAQAPYPELRDGFKDPELLKKHEKVIGIILEDSFSGVLTQNEIKVASLPYHDLTFNGSKRFKEIIEAAGDDFELKVRGVPEHLSYITGCTIILSFYYGFDLDFKRPLFYDIPDKNGVMKHYRILYNADFMELIPTDKAKQLTQDDVDELLDNFDNVEVWKEKIPPGSFIAKGFVISNMFDATTEHSISEIKSSLISRDKRVSDNFINNLQDVFRSFFNTKDLKVGFVTYNPDEKLFERLHSNGMASYLLYDKAMETCTNTLCHRSYSKLLDQHDYFTVANVDKYYEMCEGKLPAKSLKEQGIKSAIFAPISNEGKLLGILELVSMKTNALNSVNAQKLEDIMPYIVTAVMRSADEEENLIDAIIQKECTTVHSSVYWKFREQAKQFIWDEFEGKQPFFNDIVFKDVHPLYGQIDIRDSSRARNLSIQKDLVIQLSEINKIMTAAWKKQKLPVYEELIFRVDNLLGEIKEVLDTNSEQTIFDFIKAEVLPVFDYLKGSDKQMEKMILAYGDKIDPKTESYYDHRKKYDDSVMTINKKLASVIDKKQENAQTMFPHYFERYKTDGVEHNIYVGQSIAGRLPFNTLYLNNLRLWQLQVMCDMENTHYKLKPKLPVPLDVASLLLVYSTSLSIRFRLDEKRFDVDGTYNARYEVIKKRIDKSYIKGTNERLTQSGKLSIVYSQKKEELEYLRYISFLRVKGYFTNNMEIVELEGLQGVTGLKAIRVEILYNKDNKAGKTYTYSDLMDELEA